MTVEVFFLKFEFSFVIIYFANVKICGRVQICKPNLRALPHVDLSAMCSIVAQTQRDKGIKSRHWKKIHIKGKMIRFN